MLTKSYKQRMLRTGLRASRLERSDRTRLERGRLALLRTERSDTNGANGTLLVTSALLLGANGTLLVTSALLLGANGTLLVTSALLLGANGTLLVTSALLLVTRSVFGANGTCVPQFPRCFLRPNRPRRPLQVVIVGYGHLFGTSDGTAGPGTAGDGGPNGISNMSLYLF